MSRSALVDIQCYRDAVTRQFPHLDLSGFRLLGEGGVFYVFESDGELIWRFPKQPDWVACLDLEIRLLPRLTGAVSLPIPRYEYTSDCAISPRFVGYRKIEGVEFTHERRAACRSDRPLQQLARFLTELHSFPIEQAQAAGLKICMPDERRAEWVKWRDQICQRVYPLFDDQQRAWAEYTLTDLLNDDAMDDYTPTFCHGDLWAEHILFDPKREALTGVIDFESASIGDPAGDWAAIWLEQGDQVIEQLLAEYQGPVNATLRHRMMRLANNVSLNEILCGVLYDDRTSWRAGWEHLARLSASWYDIRIPTALPKSNRRDKL